MQYFQDFFPVKLNIQNNFDACMTIPSITVVPNKVYKRVARGSV